MTKKLLQVSVLLTSIFITVSAHANTQIEAVPGEYVVKLKPAALKSRSISTLSTQLKGFVKSTIPSQSVVVIQKASFESVDSAVKALNANPLVEVAEPNYIYRINKTPNDPMYGKLWGILNVGQADPKGQTGTAGIDINVEKAWDIQTGTKEKIIAVIDTGVDYNHPDLKPNMWVNEAELNGKAGVDDDGNGVVDDIYGYNAVNNTGNPKDDQGHGSHCAGTIAAKGDDGVGIVGVNWDARIMAVKFLDKNGSGTLENAIKSIDYAVKMGANVLSNSWGGGAYSQTLFDAIKRSEIAGAIFIAAAGNSYSNNDSNPAYPATYQIDNVVSVAAIDNKGKKADFSNYGKKTVHIAAPGVNIYSTTGGKYDTFSGTSMATPHVAGVAALLWANEPHLTAAQIKERLLKTARPLAGLKGKTKTGALVDAYAALTDRMPAADPNDPDNWASMPLSIQSDFPYRANLEQTFEVEVPGATEFALYFDKFDTETGYDIVFIYDEKGNLVQSLSGKQDETYSYSITGSKATIVFKTDKSVQKTGWSISKAAYRVVTPEPTPVPPQQPPVEQPPQP